MVKSKYKKLRSTKYFNFLHGGLPIMIYVVLLGAMFLLWYFRHIDEEMTMNFFAELFGAAFTLFIIDVLLVKSKAKKWKTVELETKYMISRNVHRLRDGLSYRAFGFQPIIKGDNIHEQQQNLQIERQNLYLKLDKLNEQEISEALKTNLLFTEESMNYFNEKAQDIWNIINFKHADFMHPELVNILLNLFLDLKDLSAHIKQSFKIKREPLNSKFYEETTLLGASICISKIIETLNKLKEEGFSEAASLNKNQV